MGLVHHSPLSGPDQTDMPINGQLKREESEDVTFVISRNFEVVNGNNPEFNVYVSATCCILTAEIDGSLRCICDVMKSTTVPKSLQIQRSGYDQGGFWCCYLGFELLSLFWKPHLPIGALLRYLFIKPSNPSVRDSAGESLSIGIYTEVGFFHL